MIANTNQGQDDRWSLPVLPEAVLAVRCCIVVTCRNMQTVRLRGDVCMEHNTLTLSEVAPGMWLAWLMLRPGTHYGVIEARGDGGDGTRADGSVLVVRQHFALMIPPYDKPDSSKPQLWLVRHHGLRRKDRFQHG